MYSVTVRRWLHLLSIHAHAAIDVMSNVTLWKGPTADQMQIYNYLKKADATE